MDNCMKIYMFLALVGLMLGGVGFAATTGMNVASTVAGYNGGELLKAICSQGGIGKKTTIRSDNGAYCKEGGLKGKGKNNLGGALARYWCEDAYKTMLGTSELPVPEPEKKGSKPKVLSATQCGNKLSPEIKNARNLQDLAKYINADPDNKGDKGTANVCKFLSIFIPNNVIKDLTDFMGHKVCP
jgi:hypothetical protein